MYKTRFYWNHECSALMAHYQTKRTRSVFLLSTMHSAPSTDDTDKRKPDVVHFYNANKVGVDTVDAMCRMYTTKCASRRWPVAVWSNILDIASINAWVLYREATNSSISRKDFILDIVKHLIGSSPVNDELDCEAENVSEKRVQCRTCTNKTAHTCSCCHHPVCGKCAAEIRKMSLVKCKNCA